MSKKFYFFYIPHENLARERERETKRVFNIENNNKEEFLYFGSEVFFANQFFGTKNFWWVYDKNLDLRFQRQILTTFSHPF